jgi:hypothetical protein
MVADGIDARRLPIRITPRFSFRLAFGSPTLRFAPLLVLSWCSALFAYGLSAGPLYRTESLRAIIGAECLHGNWLYPVLYGEPFLTKPPGQYAAIGLCSLPFGHVTAISARLPSVFAATAVVILIYGLFRRTLGERSAVIAALLLPTSVLWLEKVTSAEIDMTLVGWVTAALVLFHRSISASVRFSAVWMILALLCAAAGTLTKWTAPAFFYLTVVPFLFWRGQLRLLFGWRHLLGAGVATIILMSWAAAVSERVGWDTLSDTIRKEAEYRFHSPAKTKGYPWGGVLIYPLLVLAAHLPVSLFALTTLRPSFFRLWDDRGRMLLQFLHCWTWPNLIFWALVPNHNVRYALPLSPGLMGLGIMGFLAWWGRFRAIGENLTAQPPSLERKGEKRPFGGGVEEGFSPVVLHPTPWRVRLFVGFLACWLVAKIVFVEVVIPHRTAGRSAEITADQLRELVPPGETLHLFKLKDEGIMFYYGRPARKLHNPHDLPRGGYAVLIEQEWNDRAAFGEIELVRWMYDQQGDPLILVRTAP